MNTLRSMFAKALTIVRHLWLDASDARRLLPPDGLLRLTQAVALSETQHLGQIRIYVEASLPMSYLSRQGPTTSMRQLVRQRAVMQFSKLRVWDTERHSGVLIYLLLAERAIEIVADRGVSRHVTDAEWRAVVGKMGATFASQRFEAGLTEAVQQVSALLMRHFPAQSSDAAKGQFNELPDEPLVG